MNEAIDKFLSTRFPKRFEPRHYERNPTLNSPCVYCWMFLGGKTSPVYFYVGMSANPLKRLKFHIKSLEVGGEWLSWLGTNEKHRRIISKYGSSARLFILREGLTNVKDRSAWEHHAIQSLIDRFGADASCNLALTGLKPKGVHSMSDDHRTLMREKVSKQWANPEFRAANKQRLETLRSSGWVPTPVKTVHIRCKVSGSEFRVRQTFVARLFQLGGKVGGPLNFSPSSSFYQFFELLGSKLTGVNVGSMEDERLTAQEVAFAKVPEVVWLRDQRAIRPKLFITQSILNEYKQGLAC